MTQSTDPYLEEQTVTEYTLTDEDGNTRTITGIEHENWEPFECCPECGEREFSHVSFEGSCIGVNRRTSDADLGDAQITHLSDYEFLNGRLATMCQSCRTILYKSEAVDLLHIKDRFDQVNPEC